LVDFLLNFHTKANPKSGGRFFKNPTSYLVKMKCYPWTYDDKVALMVISHTLYGQGMNHGLNITILQDCIDKCTETTGEQFS
jgi:kynurenine 3-monooxygenase